MTKKWFRKAVMAKLPYTLGGWKKNLPTTLRRRKALSSRPKNWALKRRYLSAGRALIALSNVTRDKQTKKIARIDANYFFKKLK